MPTTPETVELRSRQEWRDWLEANHQQTASIQLITWPRDAGDAYVPYDAIVEEALCFGWIDSTRRKLEDGRLSLLMAPRRKGSGWSYVNKERVERLIASGLMTPSGLVRIEMAKQDGSWARLEAAEALLVPDDLTEALEALPGAAENFHGFPPSSRKVMLQWVYDAKRPETRAKRIEEIATKAAQNERAR